MMRSSTIHLLALVSLFWTLPAHTAPPRGSFFFFNKGYADHIEAEGWVLNHAQVAQLYDVTTPPKQLSRRDLTGQRNYLAVRLTNHKAKRVWGTLNCDIIDEFKVTLDVIDLDPLGEFPEYYVTPLGKVFYPDHQDEAPEIQFKWKALYTK